MTDAANAVCSAIKSLQAHFVHLLEEAAAASSAPVQFRPRKWKRLGGRFGGGERFEAPTGSIFNRGSINYSHVFYGPEDRRQLRSATAISAIVHPEHPRAPSLHMHISHTEFADHAGWRLMADLNPSLPEEAATQNFRAMLSELAKEKAAEGLAAGDRYFFIPVLGRHRGVCHFYLEDFRSAHPRADLEFAANFGRGVTEHYAGLVRASLAEGTRAPNAEERAAQLHYHTLYLFQVLTLDRGTTAGLLAHDENDLGVLGCLPRYVRRDLLEEWEGKMPRPQEKLVQSLLAALPSTTVCEVTEPVKLALASALRQHYAAHPEGLAFQAR